LKFREIKPEVYGVTFGVFVLVLFVFLMQLSEKIMSHPMLDDYITRLLDGKESLIPITVIVAVILFMVKEVLEYNRKEKANSRKLNAYRMLLAEELELNFGALKSIDGTCGELESNKDEWRGATYEAKFKESDNLYVHATYNGDLVLCNPVRKVRMKQYDNLLVSIAELDEDFYLKVKNGYKYVTELEHLYSSIIKGLQAKDNNEPFPSDITQSGFLGYALAEVGRIEPELKKLYKECAGSIELKARIR
tara:strand:+ start:5150 stop:5896 length:747 start_codon:yes stop_codon:yes gene_type:complete